MAKKRKLGLVDLKGVLLGGVALFFLLSAVAPVHAQIDEEPVVEPAPLEAPIVSLTTRAGRTVSAVFVEPEISEGGEPVPTILLVHDWWGLGDAMKSAALALADQGYGVLAMDLYDGSVPQSPAEAGFASLNVKQEEAVDTLLSGVDWLKAYERSNGKVGICGWSYGVEWMLEAAKEAPLEAMVLYYGRIEQSKNRLEDLGGPILGHFARNDVFVTETMVGEFKQDLEAAGKTATFHFYDAGHGFANLQDARYDDQDTKLAWARTLAFFDTHLRISEIQN